MAIWVAVVLGLLLGLSGGGVLAVGAQGEAPALVGATWLWQETLTGDGQRVAPADPTRYTLELSPEGRLAARADCNRATGNYAVDGNRLTLGPLAMTRAACLPGSLDQLFAAQLGAAATYQIQGDTLFVALAGDSGTMRFSRAGGTQ